MDKYTATEIAYKNGYEQGRADAEDEIRILSQKRANIFEIVNAYEKGKAAALKWIPVAERLPEVVDSYIVVVKCKYDWEKEYEIGVDIATYDPFSGNPYIDGCWHTYNDWNEGQEYLHVTHWMPLPEPPKGE